MADKFDWRTPRGTHDRLPDAEPLWRFVFETVQKRADGFGFGKIETPLIEYPQVFNKSLGETTDVVQKEMFEVRRATADKDEDTTSYVLRPENTASVVRAYLEHGMHTWPQPVKLWYFGPMFRADRPQKGRYRQFWQAGFEVFGDEDPTTDAMLIYLFWQILYDLKIQDQLIVDINSMGDSVCRPKFRKALLAYYEPKKNQLCATCQIRLEKNPLRLLDCKEPSCELLKKDAPQMVDNLCTNCREHFRVVLESLDELGVVYDLNPNLVRGFDYYTRTTFEVRAKSDERRQNALGGGGRYDGLVELMDGKATPAIGLAPGIDRIVEFMQQANVSVPALPTPDVFVIQLGERAKKNSFAMIADLGKQGFSALAQPGKDSLKAQLRLADKTGVRFALIVGQREALDGTAILRDMTEATQETILQSEIIDVLERKLRA